MKKVASILTALIMVHETAHAKPVTCTGKVNSDTIAIALEESNYDSDKNQLMALFTLNSNSYDVVLEVPPKSFQSIGSIGLSLNFKEITRLHGSAENLKSVPPAIEAFYKNLYYISIHTLELGDPAEKPEASVFTLTKRFDLSCKY